MADIAENELNLATRAIHTPRVRRDGAVVAPMHLSSTYEHGPGNEPLCDHEYVRDANPNVDDLEAKIAALEGADFAIAFASGMAAVFAALSLVPNGGKILVHENIYVDTKTLTLDVATRRGVSIKRIDMTDRSAIQDASKESFDLIWFETPTNPQLEVIDISAMASIARATGAKMLVDGSMAPPVIQRPHLLGADFVIHSLTKYMGGHSDVQGGSLSVKGAAVSKDDLLHLRRHTGGVLAPFNAWMVSRGIQTLDCRMKVHSDNALLLAQALYNHPRVKKVHYPFLNHPDDNGVARKQMNAGGGMLSLEIEGGADAAINVARRVRLFTNATSFGGPESLIEHRRSVEGEHTTSPEGLLRLSVGLEHPDDLLADLICALDTV
jgi:cystathionine gamma-synthase